MRPLTRNEYRALHKRLVNSLPLRFSHALRSPEAPMSERGVLGDYENLSISVYHEDGFIRWSVSLLTDGAQARCVGKRTEYEVVGSSPVKGLPLVALDIAKAARVLIARA